LCAFGSDEDLAQGTTPLMDRNLNPINRAGWEGELPDASQKPRSWNWLKRKR
jgi:hypothetical protein